MLDNIGLRFTICQNWLLTSAGRPQMECVSFSHLRTAFGQTNIVLDGFPVCSKAGFSVLTDGINKHPTWNYIEYTSKFLLSQTFPGILLFFLIFCVFQENSQFGHSLLSGNLNSSNLMICCFKRGEGSR